LYKLSTRRLQIQGFHRLSSGLWWHQL